MQSRGAGRTEVEIVQKLRFELLKERILRRRQSALRQRLGSGRRKRRTDARRRFEAETERADELAKKILQLRSRLSNGNFIRRKTWKYNNIFMSVYRCCCFQTQGFGIALECASTVEALLRTNFRAKPYHLEQRKG